VGWSPTTLETTTYLIVRSNGADHQREQKALLPGISMPRHQLAVIVKP
jgi:hypothetical protein